MAVRWTRKEILQLSNICYNRGLEKAQIRDMAGAIGELKKCLQLNKNHTEARNLLGLVYYETGEMADALAEWVISTNFQARNNPAIQYINKLQERQEFLNEMILASNKYNQALTLLRQDSEDLAILLLNKAIDLNPHFVRAYQLLTLVYIKRCQYAKAEKTVKKSLNIDRTNTISLRYLNELKRIAYARKKRNLQDLSKEDSSQFDGLSADDVIIPTYKGDVLGGWFTVVNLLVGIGIGIACFYYLILPAKVSELSSRYNQQLVEINRSQNVQEAQVSDLNHQISTLQADLESLQNQSSAESQTSSQTIAQYNNLLQALQKLQSAVPEEYLAGVEALGAIDVSGISDPTYLAVYQGIQADVQATAADKLLGWGKTSYDARNYDAAIAYLTQCLNYKADSSDAMLYMGMSYKEKGESTPAVEWLTRVINQFPGTPQAEQAQQERGY